MFGLFARSRASAEEPRVQVRPGSGNSSNVERDHIPHFDCPPGPPPRPTLLHRSHGGQRQKAMCEQPSDKQKEGIRHFPHLMSPRMKEVLDVTIGCGSRNEYKDKTQDSDWADLEAQGVCSQPAPLENKFEPIAENPARDDHRNSEGLMVWLDAKFSELKRELLRGHEQNNAHSSTRELHEAMKLLHGKMEHLSDKVEGALELQGQSVKSLSGQVAQLESQLVSMKDGFADLQKSMKREILLGSNDQVNVSDDNIITSLSLQSEGTVAGNASLSKTRAVQFVDLGAAQLEPSQPDLNKSHSSYSARLQQRMSRLMKSFPEYGPLHRWHSPLTLLSTLIVAMNAVFIGVSVDQTLQALLHDEQPPLWIDTVENVFAFALGADLTLRILTWGKAFFVDKSEKWWNLFDFILCCAAISEPLLRSDSGTARKFPALRIFRAIRVFRVVRQFGTLRLMLAMITHAMNNVMWAFIFIMMFTYMVAVMFMQVITNKIDEYRQEHPSAWMEHVNIGMPDDWSSKIAESYGKITHTCVTLIASISGGLDWVDASWPLYQLGGAYLVLYLAFVMFCVFGLMNILTGIFVANTKEVSRIDRDLVIRAQLNDRKSFANQLKNILRSVDKDATGTISKQELMEHLTADETAAYLKTLDVTVSDAQGVFKLLDVTGTGEVSIDEFVLSLMRFQGSARAVDVATLLYEGKRNEARWNAYMDYIEEQFDALKTRLHVDSRKTGTVETHVNKAKFVTAFSLPLVDVDAV